MIIVGTVTPDHVLVRFHGVSGMAACSAGRASAASRVPPPPME
jgi:hypothetical protein